MGGVGLVGIGLPRKENKIFLLAALCLSSRLCVVAMASLTDATQHASASCGNICV
jgi:hypothetical protein